MAEAKEGKGAAFWNKYKSKDSQPDFTGHVMVDGVEKTVGVWFSKSQQGGNLYLYLSLADKISRDPSTSDDPTRPY